MNIRQLSSRAAGFDEEFSKLLAFEETADEKLEATVASILADVRKRGDAAVLEYTAKFDRLPLEHAAAMELPQPELRAAFDGLLAEQRNAAGRLEGWSDNYLRVEIADSDPPAARNQFLNVRVTGTREGRAVTGERVGTGPERRQP